MLQEVERFQMSRTVCLQHGSEGARHEIPERRRQLCCRRLRDFRWGSHGFVCRAVHGGEGLWIGHAEPAKTAHGGEGA